jgi:hypothetical protein
MIFQRKESSIISRKNNIHEDKTLLVFQFNTTSLLITLQNRGNVMFNHQNEQTINQ